MVRADNEQIKVHFKGEHDDFVIIVESADQVRKWREDKSIPLVDVVNSFDVFSTNKHGAQGHLDRASNALLENEFGTKNTDDVVKQILEKGDLQESKNVSQAGKQGGRNDNNGSLIGNTGPVHG